MEEGVDVFSHRLVSQKLRKMDTPEPLAKALNTISKGSVWTCARLHACKPDVSPACPRCGCSQEDDLHRFWTCPKLAESNNSAILDSAELVRRAVQQAPSYPVKWLRGLQPAEFTVGLVSEHPPIPIHRASGTFLLQNMQVKGKYLVGSDASGGPATRILGREESGGGSLSWTQTSNVLAL